MNFLPSVTILYAGLFGLILLVISLNIFRVWVNIALGHGPTSSEEAWKRFERVQHSFIEFVPMCLLLMFMIEMHGAPRGVLHGLGASLVVARILHAYGAVDIKIANLLRVIGTQITFLVLMICSLAAVYYAVVPFIVGKFSGG